MCFEIGNKVAVIDDTLKGIVISINNNLITIKGDDNMEYQFTKNELVKIGVEQYQLTKFFDIDNDLLKQKLTLIKKNKPLFKKTKKEVVMEIDLHIEKLVKSTRGLDNYDMLSLQIETAKRKLEYCIQKRISKIIFIHGVGQGVLKTELEYLLKKYHVKYYDASYQKYGLGAIEVYIYQKKA